MDDGSNAGADGGSDDGTDAGFDAGPKCKAEASASFVVVWMCEEECT